jgi:signal transduction histidine kinase
MSSPIAGGGREAPARRAARPRAGLWGELLFLLPLALLLLVVVSTFTLFSYRSALLSLRDERQQEAERLARESAASAMASGNVPGAEAPVARSTAGAAAGGKAAGAGVAAGAVPGPGTAAWTLPIPSADRLRRLAPGARGVALLDARGTPLSVAGELPPLRLVLPPSQAPRPLAVGPDADLPDGVAALAPLLIPMSSGASAGAGPAEPGTARTGAARTGAAGGGAGGVATAGAAAAGTATRGALFYVRVDLPAAALGAQLRAIRLLSWVVLPVNSALVLLVVLFLRRLLTPYETLLARARQLGRPEAGGEDEAEFLIATLERALEALGERQGSQGGGGQDGRRGDDDLAAIERTLAGSLESGLLLLGRDGRVLSLNALGAALLGATPPPAAAGAALEELLAPHPELLALLAAAIAGGRPVKRQECTLLRAGGTPVALGLSVHPLRRDDGAIRGYLVLFADLTEARRRAEESRLNDRLATLGEMAAGVAHELRNSLATLRGYLTLIERRPDEESIADFLAEIRHESDHLQRVLEDFLAFARPGTARLQTFSMPALARRAAADPALAGVAFEVRTGGAGRAAAAAPGANGAAAPDANGAAAADADGAATAAADGGAGGAADAGATGAAGRDAEMRGDPQLIERALRNVLHNAAQAEREAGRRGPVEVIVDELPGGVEVTVADRGVGIPPELRDRLFHPFATGRAGGVGLGLALAHRIVTLHGGRIRLEDRQGGGTVARLFFSRLSPGDNLVTEGSTAAVDSVPAPLGPLDPTL